MDNIDNMYKLKSIIKEPHNKMKDKKYSAHFAVLTLVEAITKKTLIQINEKHNISYK